MLVSVVLSLVSSFFIDVENLVKFLPNNPLLDSELEAGPNMKLLPKLLEPNGDNEDVLPKLNNPGLLLLTSVELVFGFSLFSFFVNFLICSI